MPQDRERDAWEPITGVDMSPMIGLVLTMLIIVMVLTPSITRCFSVLPRAASTAPSPEGRVRVDIDRQGRYWLYDPTAPGPVPAHLLADRIREAYRVRAPADRVLNLTADRDVEYSSVLTLLDAAGEAGIRRIDAIADAPPRPRAGP